MNCQCRDWVNLPFDAMRLGLESQDVILLRTVKALRCDPDSGGEMALMIEEKIAAIMEIQMLFGRALIVGDMALAPARAVASYRRRVNDNYRRLSLVSSETLPENPG